MQRRILRTVSVVVAVALVAPACSGGSGDGSGDGAGSTSAAPPAPTTAEPAGSTTTEPAGATTVATSSPATEDAIPPLLDGDVVSDAALDAVLGGDGEVNQAALDAFAAEFAALPREQQEAVMADLALRAELAVSEVSGLEAAVGDRAATQAALTGAYAQVRGASDAAVAAVDLGVAPAGLRRGFASPDASPSAGAVAAVGLFMGYMALVTFASVVTGQTNSWGAGQTDVHEGNGVVYGGSLDEVSAEITFTGTQDGVDVDFSAATVIHPCPSADGSFQLEAMIDVKANKGGVGQNATLELKVDGVVGDDAEIVSKNIENHTQWSDFANSSGQFIDFTMSGPNGVDTTRINRTGGNLTQEFSKVASVMSTLIGLMIATQLVDSAEKAWKSGRCVELKVTPSAGPEGLEPSQTVDVLAEPRSKIDGAPTGGTVTATLSGGTTSVTPDGSPVPADANSTYTAASEQDKTGTVSYESKSRRGVGKASITFTTSKPAAYLVVGGLEDWQVNMVVCDVMNPFTLEAPGIGTAQFSGGLTGSYTASGIFGASYAGTYQITLDNGLGTPGTMIATSGGTTAGEPGFGSENYVLTPATC